MEPPDRRAVSKALVGVIAAAIVLAGAGGFFILSAPSAPAPPSGPGEGVVLRVITRHDSSITDLARISFLNSDLAHRFNVKDIFFIGGNPNLYRETIKGYHERGQPLDVSWGGGPTLFDDTIAAGQIAPLTRKETLAVVAKMPDTVGGAPMKRFDKEGRVLWVAAAISSFGFIVNEPVLKSRGLPWPKLWEDLSGADFSKALPLPAVAYASPSLSTSHTRIYEIILQKFGWEKGWSILARIAANGRSYPGSVEALTAVQSGEVPVSIAIDFYGYSSEIQFPGTKYVLPQGESIVNGDPIALLATSANSDAAQAFIEWVLSPDGQKVWLAQAISRLPVTAEVFQTPEGRQRLDLYRNYNATIVNIGIEFNDPLALSYEFAMKIYFDAVLGDLHGELVAAWQKLNQALRDGKLSRERFEALADQLGKPLSWMKDGKSITFTEEYAISINEAMKNPAQASEMAKIWRDAARARYQEILRSVP